MFPSWPGILSALFEIEKGVFQHIMGKTEHMFPKGKLQLNLHSTMRKTTSVFGVPVRFLIKSTSIFLFSVAG